MKFDNNGMAVSAAWVWHEAFNTGVTSIDYREVLNTFGVQFSAKGGDNKTMDHCEKGIIQQAIEKLKHENHVAWAWGMHAYAPDGSANKILLTSVLFGYIMGWMPDNTKIGGDQFILGSLAWIAIQDAKTESHTSDRVKRKAVDMAQLVKVSQDDYEKVWRWRFFLMKDHLKDLSGQALPPIANVIWAMVDKKDGDFAERMNASEDLIDMLKMPVGAV